MYNVIFMGGKSIGCQVLDHLLSMDDVNILAVFTNLSDTMIGAWYPSASQIAADYDIPIYCYLDVNDTVTVDHIKQLNPDLIVVAYYDQILKRDIINIPRLGCINLHFALAEEYRGCYPTTWAIINGEKRGGVTLHYIDTGIDSGDIIAQSEVPILDSDTGLDLYDKCTEAGVHLFEENIDAILAGDAGRREQATTNDTHYYRRDQFPPHKIHLDTETLNHIRSVYFPPFPLPYIMIGDRKFVIIEEREMDKCKRC